MAFELSEIKTLIIIGGFPLLCCLLGFACAFVVSPADGYVGMLIIGAFSFLGAVVSLILSLKNIWVTVSQTDKDLIRMYFDADWR